MHIKIIFKILPHLPKTDKRISLVLLVSRKSHIPKCAKYLVGHCQIHSPNVKYPIPAAGLILNSFYGGESPPVGYRGGGLSQFSKKIYMCVCVCH
jgi:hypothetical protein